MIRNRSARLVVFALLLAVAALPACSQQEPPTRRPSPEPTPESTATEPTGEAEPSEPAAAGEWEAAEPTEEVLTPEEINRMGVLKTIYFDYDRSEIRADQRPVLQANANWLRQHPDVSILIEGHCDERGTREYNLALGDRRADAARDYLVSLGISADRIDTVSYGEERPAAEGSNEAAWSQNRRAEFVVVANE